MAQFLSELSDIKEGRKAVVFDSGNTYDGQWKEKAFHGYGEYTWADGRKYRGNFNEGKRHGNGEFLWPDGKKYVGEHYMDMAEGNAIVTLGDGRSFEGRFLKDFPINGQLIESNGDTWRATFDGSTYVSEWSPVRKEKVGKFESGSEIVDENYSFREFVWCDGRRFAGKCVGFRPISGVFTEENGIQYAVSYSGKELFADQPKPLAKMLLKTQVHVLHIYDTAPQKVREILPRIIRRLNTIASAGLCS